jgi:hypothetical protein
MVTLFRKHELTIHRWPQWSSFFDDVYLGELESVTMANEHTDNATSEGASGKITLGRYMWERIHQVGVDTIFGVPGNSYHRRRGETPLSLDQAISTSSFSTPYTRPADSSSSPIKTN